MDELLRKIEEIKSYGWFDWDMAHDFCDLAFEAEELQQVIEKLADLVDRFEELKAVDNQKAHEHFTNKAKEMGYIYEQCVS